MTEPTEAMSQCDTCGKQWPSAAQGVIHKCTCTGGMCSPMNAAPDIHRVSSDENVSQFHAVTEPPLKADYNLWQVHEFNARVARAPKEPTND